LRTLGGSAGASPLRFSTLYLPAGYIDWIELRGLMLAVASPMLTYTCLAALSCTAFSQRAIEAGSVQTR
jgi:hypothetical protein